MKRDITKNSGAIFSEEDFTAGLCGYPDYDALVDAHYAALEERSVLDLSAPC